MAEADPSQFYVITYPSRYYAEYERRSVIIGWICAMILSVAVWDCIICLPMEYERVWKKKKTLVSYLYLASRYWGLLCLSYYTFMYTNDQHTFEYCEKWHAWAVGLAVPVEFFAGAILAIRTIAFSGQKRWVTVVVILGLLTQTGYMLIIPSLGSQLAPFFQIGQTRGRCFTGGNPDNHLIIGNFASPALFTCLCTFLTLYFSWKLQRETHSAGRSPLVRVFIRDGLMYFVAVLVANLVNVGFFIQTDQSLSGSGYFFMVGASTLMSSRLVLSLRSDEATRFSSAAGGVVTRSYWKTRQSNMNHTHAGAAEGDGRPDEGEIGLHVMQSDQPHSHYTPPGKDAIRVDIQRSTVTDSHSMHEEEKAHF